MKRLRNLLVLACMLTIVSMANAAQEKVTIDKLPKGVVDAITAKFPKAELKRATKETEDGKTFYEVIFNNEKMHLHALVTAEGKLYEIHRHVERKDMPEKAAKAVDAKYPKAVW